MVSTELQKRIAAEQNVGPKPPTVHFEMVAVLAGALLTL